MEFGKTWLSLVSFPDIREFSIAAGSIIPSPYFLGTPRHWNDSLFSLFFLFAYKSYPSLCQLPLSGVTSPKQDKSPSARFWADCGRSCGMREIDICCTGLKWMNGAGYRE